MKCKYNKCDGLIEKCSDCLLDFGVEQGKLQAQKDIFDEFGKLIEYGLNRQENLLDNNPLLSDFKPQEILELKKEFNKIQALKQEETK